MLWCAPEAGIEIKSMTADYLLHKLLLFAVILRLELK